jgi:tRNA(Ile2)-agmatinylcytidine synthase
LRFLVGIDDTDSSRGLCTTFLAYRIAVDLYPQVTVLPYPRLVRLNPNIPFKTRGNAAVCLLVEADDPDLAFELLSAKVQGLSDVEGGANSGMVFFEDGTDLGPFERLYVGALTGVVNPARARRLLKDSRIRHFELGNGMGLVGAAASLGFDPRSDHTYELISYRERSRWGTPREVDSASVRQMDRTTFPHTYNNYDYQKRKVLICPHGPDPVFAGVRGDSPSVVKEAFSMLRYEEPLAGHMIYVTNQQTDAHIQQRVNWMAFSSGWIKGTVTRVETGQGGHVYVTVRAGGKEIRVAAYEPTGDLRRAARLLRRGDRVRAYGGVRKPSTLNPAVLNLEKLELISPGGPGSPLVPGTYVSSPRANRHLTMPLSKYGSEVSPPAGPILGWLDPAPTQRPMLARSPQLGPRNLRSRQTP